MIVFICIDRDYKVAVVAATKFEFCQCGIRWSMYDTISVQSQDLMVSTLIVDNTFIEMKGDNIISMPDLSNATIRRNTFVLSNLTTVPNQNSRLQTVAVSIGAETTGGRFVSNTIDAVHADVFLHLEGNFGIAILGNVFTNTVFSRATLQLETTADTTSVRSNIFGAQGINMHSYNLEMSGNCNCPQMLLNATGNWWGGVHSDLISDLVKDRSDVPTLMLVDFSMPSNNANAPCETTSQCSGHGRCLLPEICTCDPGFKGRTCELYDCSDVYDCNSERSAGECVAPNNCRCSKDWLPPFCLDPVCDTSCSGNGFCRIPNVCTCFTGFEGTSCDRCKSGYWGKFCHPCPNCVHGQCDVNGKCLCRGLWTGRLCDIPTCPARNDCNGRGDCSDINTCSCHAQYDGDDCTGCKPKLWGPWCSFNCPKCVHGKCDQVRGGCICNKFWTGPLCNKPICSTQNHCSGHGKCVGPNKCECDVAFTNEKCSEYVCESLCHIVNLKKPEDVSLPCGISSSILHTGQATAEGNCDKEPVLSYHDVSTNPKCGRTRRIWKATDFCNNSVSAEQQIKYFQAYLPPISPLHMQTGVPLTKWMEWTPLLQAIKYEMIVWPSGTDETAPAAYCTVKRNKCPVRGLQPLSNFSWFVRYHMADDGILLSNVSSFQTIDIAELVVSKVIAPRETASGLSVEISWTVSNPSPVQVASRSWCDAIYISAYLSWPTNVGPGVTHKKLACVPNPSFLDAYDGYSQHFRVKLPEDIVGSEFYIYVYANANKKVPERRVDNNAGRSQKLNIRLSPLPDLVPNSLTVPAALFSGTTIEATYIFQNEGEHEVTGPWTDCFYLSTEQILTRTAIFLSEIKNVPPLLPLESRKVIKQLEIPQKIDGTHYILVQVNCRGDIYEHDQKSNNFFAEKIDVVMSPPPDLQVIDINLPKSITTNQKYVANIKIANNGAGAPFEQYWYDEVSIRSKKDSQFSKLRLGVIKKLGPVEASSSYSFNVSFILPQKLNGDFIIEAQTDIYQNVFEYESDHNNRFALPVQVFKNIPRLQVKLLECPEFVLSGNLININYTIKNEGATAHALVRGQVIPVQKWTDSISLCKDGDCVPLANVKIFQSTGLTSSTTYSKSISITIPASLVSGTYFIKVVVDNFQQASETSANERALSKRVVIKEAWAQLKIEVSVPEVILAGHLVEISWRVTNVGSAPTNATNWIDCVDLVKSEADIDSCSECSKNTQLHSSLAPNAEYNRSTTVSVSVHDFGRFHVILRTFCGVSVYQGPVSRNTMIVKSVYVKPVATPNLVPTSVDVKTSNPFGPNLLDFHIFIVNKGATADSPMRWASQIFICHQNNQLNSNPQDVSSFLAARCVTINPSIDTAVSSFGAGSQLFLKHTGIIPTSLYQRSGTVFAYLLVDSSDNVTEVGGEKDNVIVSLPFYLDAQPERWTDLEATLGDCSFRAMSGSLINISFTVQNVDTRYPSKETSWTDRVTIHSIDGKVIASGFHTRIGSLRNGDSYAGVVQLQLPGRLHGQLACEVESDCFKSVNDPHRQNNFAASGKSGLFIEQAALANLVPSKVEVSSTLSKGNVLIVFEQVQIQYTLQNSGFTDTSSGFLVGFFLSRDKVFDKDDIFLGEQPSARLMSNAMKSYDFMLRLPGRSGVSFVLIVADYTNKLIELSEIDNVAASDLLKITLPTPTDLIVTNVLAPRSVNLGDRMKVYWDIQNIGDRATKGWVCDTSYLSQDSKWRVTDWTAGTFCSQIQLPSKAHMELSLTTLPVKRVQPGLHTVTIRANIKNSISETARENNYGAAQIPTNVTITPYSIGQEKDIEV